MLTLSPPKKAIAESSSFNLPDFVNRTSKQPPVTKPQPAENGSGNNVERLVKELANVVESAVKEIRRVNDSTHTLALNARIEAARAGQYGAAFGVVASEMQDLSSRTTEVADRLATTTNVKINTMLSIIGSTIRGTRLSDLALTNIDLIDRCLYERTCDVRWWATDSSLTEALHANTTQAHEYASQRMAVILGAYTVYLDLVLCDLDGNIVASGRPLEYPNQGRNVSHCAWFNAAMATRSGNEFGFQSAHASDLVQGQPALVYSCTVRSKGQADGRPLGVLGILFNWSSLAEPILRNVPVAEEEKSRTECFIVDSHGVVLASQFGCVPDSSIRLPDFSQIVHGKKGFYTAEFKGHRCCIAHAAAPGFETYSTNWYSVIVQRID